MTSKPKKTNPRGAAGNKPRKTSSASAPDVPSDESAIAAGDDIPAAEATAEATDETPAAARKAAPTGGDTLAAVLEQTDKAKREVTRTVEAGLGRWASAPAVAAMFLTRLPIRAPGTGLAGAVSAFPLVGLLVGALGGCVYWLTAALNLPPLAGGLLAVAAMAVLTGALHEDGFADMADGLAGKTIEDSIRIMRDSGTGAFGVLALTVGVGLRAATIAAIAAPVTLTKIGNVTAAAETIADPKAALFALLAAGALSRAALPVIMHRLPLATGSGQAARAGKPLAVDVGIALFIAILATLLLLGPRDAIVAVLAGAAAALAVAFIARRRLGGHTGDVLGATQQATEIAVLLAIASNL